MKNLCLMLAGSFVIFIYSCKSKDQPKEEPGQAKKSITLTLPSGFTSAVVADSVGDARHLVVNSNGDIYVKLEKLKDNHGIIRLRDTNNDGVADSITGFGNYGGTGIAIKNSYLFASSDDNIYRYKMENNDVSTSSEEMIVEGLLNKREHSSKSIALDN